MSRLHADTGDPTKPIDFEKYLKNKIEKTGEYQDVTRNYHNMYHYYNFLVNEREQEIWADRKSKVRILYFRIMTAIGVGLVILGFYALGHYWDIPLPLRMPL